MNGWRLHHRFEVAGRPATFATALEGAWKAAVAGAMSEHPFPNPNTQRFRVVLDFRTTSKRSDERWDIDNLAKPTLDAMEGNLRASKVERSSSTAGRPRGRTHRSKASDSQGRNDRRLN